MAGQVSASFIGRHGCPGKEPLLCTPWKCCEEGLIARYWYGSGFIFRQTSHFGAFKNETNEHGLTLPAHPIRMSEFDMPTERPTIIFDVLDKSVAILRGSDFVTLPGPFVSQAEGMAAAREECIKRGWIPRSEHSETHR